MHSHAGRARRAVLFDLYHTLVPGGSDGLRHLVTSTMGDVLGVDPGRFAAAFHESWPERFAGKLGDLPTTVRRIAERVGGTPTARQLAEATELRRELTVTLLAGVSTETLTVLDKLRADGWLTGLVSNTTAETPGRFRAGPLAARFDGAAFSCELGVSKPDRAIYLATCEQLRVDPAECVYVGDGADQELAAAAALGMQAVRTREHADTDPGWPGPTIAHLAELAPLLDGVPSA